MQEDKIVYHIWISNNGEAPDKRSCSKGCLYNLSRHKFDYRGKCIYSHDIFCINNNISKKELDHEEGIIVEDQGMPS